MFYSIIIQNTSFSNNFNLYEYVNSNKNETKFLDDYKNSKDNFNNLNKKNAFNENLNNEMRLRNTEYISKFPNNIFKGCVI